MSEKKQIKNKRVEQDSVYIGCLDILGFKKLVEKNNHDDLNFIYREFIEKDFGFIATNGIRHYLETDGYYKLPNLDYFQNLKL